jgi:phosphatidylserine synthase 2
MTRDKHDPSEEPKSTRMYGFSNLLDRICYRTHNISLLVTTLILLTTIGVTWDSTDTINNVKRGLFAVACVFCMIGLIESKGVVFVRPHPIIWKVVLSVTFLYLLALVFLLFQNVHDARDWLNLYDSSLGRPLPEKSYDIDCSLTWPNINVS